MPETQTTNAPNYEKVWAIMKEVAESQKETDRIVKETAENLKKTDRMLARHEKSANKRLGALTNLFGDMTEAMVAPKICKKFEEIGLYFPKANPNSRLNDWINNISFEVDIMLENGEKAMLIEVKTKLTLERIDKHMLRLEKMRKYADLYGDKRTFLGAVAGIVVTDEIRNYALDQGLYFIEYAGETFYITPPKDEPKEW
jgi:predicted AAA+ superfamily ATPase